MKSFDSNDSLKKAIDLESEEFSKSYHWLEEHLPPIFFEEISQELRILIARNLMSFQLQDHFSQIHIKNKIIVLCLDTPDADLKILKNYPHFAIRYYKTYVSKAPLPNETGGVLRIALLHVGEIEEEKITLSQSEEKELYQIIHEKHPTISSEVFEGLIKDLSKHFFGSLKKERLSLALDVYFRAIDQDECQYEIRKVEDWKKKNSISIQIVIAWRNVPKSSFLYRLIKTMHAHHLEPKKIVSTYVDPYGPNNTLLMSMGLHGINGKAAWDVADIDDLIREICLLKYFGTEDLFAEVFIKSNLLTGNETHWVRNAAIFTHQLLVYVDPNLYSRDNIYEALCRHPELTVLLCKAFTYKFHPQNKDLKSYEQTQSKVKALIDKIDTGHPINDTRRKNILKTTSYFIEFTLKTNFYKFNKTGFSFRMDPKYLDFAPFHRADKFPELPFGIFFVRGMHFIGFNIRFKDLSRGGVRTVIPERWETYFQERNTIFSEAYNLAYTQQKKNKDIPEGGSKTAILLTPVEIFSLEEEIYKKEMIEQGIDPLIIQEKLKIYHRDTRLSYIHASQRSFIQCLTTLINCDETGKLKASQVLDYWKKPEYIYLGPDENMFNEMITWISDFAVKNEYKPGRAFISGKPGAGINHKEFGVTSFGVSVYLHQALLALNIHPDKDSFTLKISGGPDGDVAGNIIHILAGKYKKTAKLLALTDVSGTIYDPIGLDWDEMDLLFKTGRPIRFYPPEKLNEGGFLLDLQSKREESAYAQQTKLIRKMKSSTQEEWLSGNEMNHLYRTNVHQVKTDVFVPCGGRPRTLNESNIHTFLDESGMSTSLAIVEGANLYLTPQARHFLENKGVLIIKDSSCNKGGVICSSFEVLASLCLTEDEFLKEKNEYVKEVLKKIQKAALLEAKLILETYRNTQIFCTDISDRISEKINIFKYQILNHLETIDLSNNPDDPLIHCLLLYAPPLLRKKYQSRLLQIPDIHKKAIISVFLAARIVYLRGLEWNPSISDMLETLAKDPEIIGDI